MAGYRTTTDCPDVPERYLQLAASVLADSGNYNALEKIVNKADAPENLIWSYYQALLTLKATGTVELPHGLIKYFARERRGLVGPIASESREFRRN